MVLYFLLLHNLFILCYVIISESYQINSYYWKLDW